MITKTNKNKQNLSERDIEALKSIYDFRCLSFSQIYDLYYKKSSLNDNKTVSDNYCKKKLNYLVSLGLLEKTDHRGEDVFFLTSQGIDFMKKHFAFPANIYDPKKKVVKRGYYRASELKVSEKYINHQLHLNQFMIDFIHADLKVPYKYYDEKHISTFKNIRPDGLLNALDVDFFIEIDMSTESKKQLSEKWDNYRNFLASREYEYAERKIVVLFIVSNPNRAEQRIDLVKHTIESSILDQVNQNFEIHVDTPENILKLLRRMVAISVSLQDNFTSNLVHYISKENFLISSGSDIKDVFNGTEFLFYCRKVKDNSILIENGKVQEFVIDTYLFSPLSVISKLAYLNFINSFFNYRYKRDISYIIVAPSEDRLYRDLKVMDLVGIDNVYFTTLKRLKEKSFYEALFQFDFLGNIHSFTNSGLNERVFERSLESSPNSHA